MKKTVGQYQIDEFKYFCDKHPDRECFSQLVLSSWYGSEFDLNVATVHLCDECVKNVYDYIKKEFNVDPKEIEI